MPVAQHFLLIVLNGIEIGTVCVLLLLFRLLIVLNGIEICFVYYSQFCFFCF